MKMFKGVSVVMDHVHTRGIRHTEIDAGRI